jgi:hypothetical protein
MYGELFLSQIGESQGGFTDLLVGGRAVVTYMETSCTTDPVGVTKGKG